MKTIALVTLCIALNSSLVFAAECTADDLTKISKVYSGVMADGTTSCPDLTTTADTSDYCSFTDCLGLMSDMVDDLPDCTSSGVSVKEAVKAVIDFCTSGKADTSGIVTDTSSSTPTTSSSSSLRTSTPSTDSTSDKVTESTAAPEAGSSSSGSSIGVALSSVVVSMTAFFLASL